VGSNYFLTGSIMGDLNGAIVIAIYLKVKIFHLFVSTDKYQ
jgi:hypothetical protein